MYYDPDKPFSIVQWNTLIRDINVILSETHGPNCWTNTRLDEVNDPHLWSVEDVQMVRDALSETCPDMVWQEEVVLWKQSVIDEIEQNMASAWCNCDETEQPLCTLSYGFVAALSAELSGNPTQSPTGTYLCPGHPAYEVLWDPETFYPIPSNENYPLVAIIDEYYSVALNACSAYINAINRLFELSDEIQEEQNKIDEAVGNINHYKILQADEVPGSDLYWEYQAQIDNYDFWAGYFQKAVDAKLDEFITQYSTMQAKRVEADNAAAVNWDAAARLKLRFPGDSNIVADYLISSVTNANWGDWFDPESRSTLGSPITFRYGYLSYSAAGPAWPVYVVWYHQEGWSADRQGTYTLRISPGGVPFIAWGYASAMCRKLNIGYYTAIWRWFCDRLAGECGDGGLPCQWGPWREPIDHYWDQGYPLASSASNPGNFIMDPLDYGSVSKSLYRQPETWHLEIQKPLEWQRNNAAKQQAFWNTYLNWHDEHPKYMGPDSV